MHDLAAWLLGIAKGKILAHGCVRNGLEPTSKTETTRSLLPAFRLRRVAARRFMPRATVWRHKKRSRGLLTTRYR